MLALYPKNVTDRIPDTALQLQKVLLPLQEAKSRLQHPHLHCKWRNPDCKPK
jgi:hypothetical protein